MSRTNIDIDDELMAETMRITGQKTKKGAVEEAMRQLTRAQIMRDLIEKTRGIGWDGDLDEMRQGRDFSTPQDGVVPRR
jgi:Arc/MetJ family transcription regulator